MIGTRMPKRLCLTRQMSHMLSLRKHQGVCAWCAQIYISEIVHTRSLYSESKESKHCLVQCVLRFQCSNANVEWMEENMFVYLIFLSLSLFRFYVINALGERGKNLLFHSCCVVLSLARNARQLLWTAPFIWSVMILQADCIWMLLHMDCIYICNTLFQQWCIKWIKSDSKDIYNVTKYLYFK